MATLTVRRGSRRQPEASRDAILRAAVKEFADNGIAGARTDAIARAARVNKALLYYYYKDKEALYDAVLDGVFSSLKARVFEVLDSDLSPREKILGYVGSYFDYIASNPLYPKLVQREMMRAGSQSARLRHIVEDYFKPIFAKLTQVFAQGIQEGDFRDVNPMHFVPSVIAMIVFYFSSAPVMQIMIRGNPLAPERVAERRAAVLDFVSHALFCRPEPARRARK